MTEAAAATRARSEAVAIPSPAGLPADRIPEVSPSGYLAGCLAIAAALLLSACGPDGFDATYRDQSGLSEYHFSGDGTVEITSMGISATAEYEQRNDNVIVHAPHGTLVLKRRGGHLEGPMGLDLVPVTGDANTRQGDDP